MCFLTRIARRGERNNKLDLEEEVYGFLGSR